MNRPLAIALLAASLMLPMAPAMAADQERAQDQLRVQSRDHEPIYGSQMMTERERNEYRQRMNEAKTAQEREQIRLEHHRHMQERARAQGLSLPENPPDKGGGMGPGGGKGMGGNGMGGGRSGGGMGGKR